MCEDDKPCAMTDDDQAAAVVFAGEIHTRMKKLMVVLNEWQPSPPEVALAAAVLTKFCALGGMSRETGNEMLMEYARLTQLIPYASPDKAGPGQQVRFELISMRQMASELLADPTNSNDPHLKVSEMALQIMGEPMVRLEP